MSNWFVDWQLACRTFFLHGKRASVLVRACVIALSSIVVLGLPISGDAVALVRKKENKKASANTLIHECFDEALEAAAHIKDKNYKMSALLAIGRAQLQGGDNLDAVDNALLVLKQMPIDAENTEDPGADIGFTGMTPFQGLLSEAIDLLAKSGDQPDALSAVNRLHDPEDRAEAYLELADSYHSNASVTVVRSLLRLAANNGQSTEDASFRSEVLSRVIYCWRKVDPEGIPSSLVQEAIDSAHEAERSFLGRNRKQPQSKRRPGERYFAWATVFPESRLVKSLARIGAINDAMRVANNFRGLSVPTLQEDIESVLSPDSRANEDSALITPETVPFQNDQIASAIRHATQEDRSHEDIVQDNLAELGALSKIENVRQVLGRVRLLSAAPWPTMNNQERQRFVQERTLLLENSDKLTKTVTQAIALPCAFAFLDEATGDKEHARVLIDRVRVQFDSYIQSDEFVMTIGVPDVSATGVHKINRSIYGSMISQISDAMFDAYGADFTLRFIDAKGGGFEYACLSNIANRTSREVIIDDSLSISAEIGRRYGIVLQNQTMNNINTSLIRMHRWNDAHRVSISMVEPVTRVHALCDVINALYRQSAS